MHFIYHHLEWQKNAFCFSQACFGLRPVFGIFLAFRRPSAFFRPKNSQKALRPDKKQQFFNLQFQKVENKSWRIPKKAWSLVSGGYFPYFCLLDGEYSFFKFMTTLYRFSHFIFLCLEIWLYLLKPEWKFLRLLEIIFQNS